MFGAGLPAERFFSTPKAGCSEFNLAGSPEADRRASLALIDEATAPASVPCSEGDAGACPVAKGETGGARCKFYTRWFEPEQMIGGKRAPELPDVGEDVHVVLWNAQAFESTDGLQLAWSDGATRTSVVDQDARTAPTWTPVPRACGHLKRVHVDAENARVDTWIGQVDTPFGHAWTAGSLVLR